MHTVKMVSNWYFLVRIGALGSRKVQQRDSIKIPPVALQYQSLVSFASYFTGVVKLQ